MKIISDFKDYEIIDLNNGEKLERWKNITLRRPDPQVIWKNDYTKKWEEVDAFYKRSDTGGGTWQVNNKKLSEWIIDYKNLKFKLKLMNFKHTGLFPEQAYNWNYIIEKLDNTKNKKVLNLFGYTGAASIVALSKGAEVVHVDSSKGMVSWAKENVELNNLQDKTIHYIVEDVVKFVKREIRRGHKYDAIIMDPPSFGKGSKGEIWKFENDFYDFLNLITELLYEDSMFVIISTYTTGISTSIIEDCINLTINKKYKGTITSDEIGFKSKNNLILPCGNYIRWEKE